MNYEEKKLIDELTKASKDCKDLIELIDSRSIPAEELKKLYKELKNYHKNRLKEIKSMKKPLNVDTNIYNRFIRNYEEALANGFITPSNGSLEKMIFSLDEASYRFVKSLS